MIQVVSCKNNRKENQIDHLKNKNGIFLQISKQ